MRRLNPCSVLALFLASMVVAARGHLPASAQEHTLGPAAPSEFALWPRDGLELLTHLGGVQHGLAYELKRPILWIAAGPRVEALAVEGERIRRVGRTPVFPGLVKALAVGDGVVLAAYGGARPGLMLVDGRDPTWPRSVRRLRIDGPVDAMAILGREAILAVGDELLSLDFSDIDDPGETERTRIRQLDDGARVVEVAIDGRRHAVLLSDGTVLLRDVRSDDPFKTFTSIEEDGTWSTLILGEGRLIVGEGGYQQPILGYALDAPQREPWRIPSDAKHSTHTIRVVGDRLLFLTYDYALYRATLRHVRMPTVDGPGGEEPTPSGPAIDLGRVRTAGISLSLALAAKEGSPAILLVNGELRAIPPEALLGHRPLDTPTLRDPLDTVVAMSGRPGWLAIAGRGAVVELWNVRRPGAPHVVGRWRAPPDRSGSPTWVHDLAWEGSILWVCLAGRLVALDVSDPRRPVQRFRRPANGDDRIAISGSWIWLAGQEWWLRLPVTPNGSLRAMEVPWTGLVTAMTATEDTLWIATIPSRAATTTTELWKASLDEHGDVRQLTRHEIPQRVDAVAAFANHLVALIRGGATTADHLQIYDASDPQGLVPLGEIDLDAPPFSGSAGRPDIAIEARGNEVLVAYNTIGLLRIDLSHPRFPDESGRLTIPGLPTSSPGVNTMSLYWDRDMAWVGSGWAGVVGARLSPLALDPAGRLFLPRLAGGMGFRGPPQGPSTSAPTVTVNVSMSEPIKVIASRP